MIFCSSSASSSPASCSSFCSVSSAFFSFNFSLCSVFFFVVFFLFSFFFLLLRIVLHLPPSSSLPPSSPSSPSPPSSGNVFSLIHHVHQSSSLNSPVCFFPGVISVCLKNIYAVGSLSHLISRQLTFSFRLLTFYMWQCRDFMEHIKTRHPSLRETMLAANISANPRYV